MTFADIKAPSLSLSRILSLSWSIYLDHFVDILLVTLIINVPLNIALQFTGRFVNNVLVIIFSVLSVMAIVFISERAVNGETLSFSQALRLSTARWASAIGTNLLAGIILLLLSLLLILPGIIWAVYYAFSSHVVALRNEGGKSALDYSKALVQGQWGRVFGIGFILSLLAIVVLFGIGLVLNTGGSNAVIDIVATTLGDVVTAYTTVAITVLFLNLDYQKNLNHNELPADAGNLAY
jgi:hypothetical protein